jgi:hypothetical protein
MCRRWISDLATSQQLAELVPCALPPVLLQALQGYCHKQQ